MSIQLSAAEKNRAINSTDLAVIMQNILLREDKIDQDREHFWVVGLSSSNRILFIDLVAKGSKTSVQAEPMEVFSFALQKRAVKIILVHNHPCGDLKPSDGDKNVTDKLIQVGLIVKVPVEDHLIISTNQFMSFEDTGMMDVLKASLKFVPNYKLESIITKRANEIFKERIANEKNIDRIKIKIKIVKRLLKKGISLKEAYKLADLPEHIVIV